MDELREAVAFRILEDNGFTVVTVNLDHLYKLSRNEAFYQAYRKSNFVTADGFPVVLIGRLLGYRIARVTGADLIRPMAGLAAQHDVPIAILGASDESTERAADVLKSENPGLNIVMRDSPILDPVRGKEQVVRVLERLGKSGARMCFLAFGAPKQELIAAMGREICPRVGFFAIGAAIDFISGKDVRAPRYVQAIALEWLWRLARDPRRLAVRYLRCFEILPRLAITSVVPRWRDSRSA